MEILVVGSGNCGITYATDLTLKGHVVSLLKTSNVLLNHSFNHLLKNGGLASISESGNVSEARISKVSDSFEDIFSNGKFYDVIIITVQTNFHEQLIIKLKSYLKPDSIVLLEPGYGSTAYFLKNKIDCIVVEAQSSPIDCRVDNLAQCEVLFRNVRNPIGIFPQNKLAFTKQKLENLRYNFHYLDSVLEAALHNPNLIVHTVGAIMSIPRIEHSKGEYWMYKEVFTPSVWNIVEGLDSEKNKVLNALGLPTLSYLKACKFRNFLDENIDPKNAFFEYAFNFSPKGPSVSNSRYITEDVPEGLVLLESLGSLLDIETPVCTSLIKIASTSLGIDFRSIGRSVTKLGLTNEHINLLANIQK